MTNVPNFELETHYRIFDNKNGTHITVMPDRDGLDLIEINDSSQSSLRLIMTKEQASLVVEALTNLINNPLSN